MGSQFICLDFVHVTFVCFSLGNLRNYISLDWTAIFSFWRSQVSCWAAAAAAAESCERYNTKQEKTPSCKIAN